MKRILLPILLCWLLALPAAGDKQPQPAIAVKVQYLDESQKDLDALAAMRRAMDKPIDKVQLNGVGLGEAIESLHAQSGVRLGVNWSTLEIVGVTPESLVDYETEDSPLSQVLSDILARVSAEAFDDDKCGYAVRPGRVEVSTLRELRSDQVRRAYDLTQVLREPFRPVGLLFSEDAFEDTVAFHAWLRGERAYPFTDVVMVEVYRQHVEKMQAEIDRLDPLGQVPDKPPQPGAGGGGGGGLFGADDAFGDLQENEHTLRQIDELKELIAANVGQEEEWLDFDSRMEVHKELLVVKTTRANHRALHKLLNTLLQAEVDRQATILKDAQASQWVAEANRLIKQDKLQQARRLIDLALRVMPGHVPANATKQVLDVLLDEPEEVG